MVKPQISTSQTYVTSVWNDVEEAFNVRADTDDLDFWMRHAIEEIESDYSSYLNGAKVRIKPKSLQKFGKTGSLAQDTATTVAVLGASDPNETYLSANSIDGLSCTNNSYTGVITVEGHTIDTQTGYKTFVVQNVTATGNSKATLTTPLARATRAYAADGTFASPATAIGGAVYVYASSGVTLSGGVPQTSSSIKCVISSGDAQSKKCATAFSSVDFGIVTQIYGSASRSSASAEIDFEFQIANLGGLFRERFDFTVRTASQSGFIYNPRPFLIVPVNADCRMQVLSDAAGGVVTAGFDALFGLVQS